VRPPANSNGTRAGSQSLKAVLEIRDLLYAGTFAAGERLSEPALADRLGLSRTPIRAALVRLEQEGLLEVIPSGGYTARRFPASEVIEAIEIRGVLEGTAARLAAERGLSPRKLAAFHRLNAELDLIVSVPIRDLDYEAYIDRNETFHRMLKEAPDSAFIAREIDRATALPFAGPSAILNAQVDIPEFRTSLSVGQSHHRAIVEAIEAREGARAEAMTREHARLARRNLKLVMKEQHLADQLPGLTLVDP